MGSRRPPGGLQEGSWDVSGGLWGGVLRAFWGVLGGDAQGSEHKVVVGGVSGPPWGRLGTVLGPSWGHLGASWGRLGASLGPLGAIFEPAKAS